MGFDLGKFMGHLLISYFSQDGLATVENDRKEMKEYILTTVQSLWNDFTTKFLKLWNTEHKGDLYLNEMINNDAELLKMIQEDYIKNLFEDVVGFMAVSCVRRVHGIASNPDMLAIKDESVRAKCEIKQLNFGRELLIKKFDSMEQVLDFAKSLL
jgi:5-methylthioribose kinase